MELPAPNDPSVVQYPRCVRLKRWVVGLTLFRELRVHNSYLMHHPVRDDQQMRRLLRVRFAVLRVYYVGDDGSASKNIYALFYRNSCADLKSKVFPRMLFRVA